MFTGKKEKFASQWGAIRAIALSKKTAKDIYGAIKDYISSGVKKDNWLGARTTELENFMKIYYKEDRSEQENGNLREAIINLASAMGKECSTKTEKEDENGNQ